MVTTGTRYQQTYKEKRRAAAKVYLGGACVRCGETESLQFDHVDPETKVIDVSLAIARCWSWERLVGELDKCQLLCIPHHLEKTRSEGSQGGVPWNKILEPKHGTGTMYSKPHRCRCPVCKDWKRREHAGEVNWRGEPVGEMQGIACHS